ncbi:ribosomal protein S18-alanine N-acetyltransferase [Melissococcus plutonius]|uniref:Ribosomal-protein-S18p-alanine acetyltransferase n=2 Tax=Melissococcus plutonius TaxID=33970 RepID=F3YB37_MELPT|nr:ribosomal protein S18-alanine N-acetyltransferase [Melissococcus plutonius]BAL61935.1 ribosomal-protein-S18p-alanine acetyltransferase [Melissococcus plutonius DAT561]AIM25835.1 ribosomal-protein-S18p-alanine acetyltransferase [Melissococcus plutonius S1]KMT25395.1 ribosomal-protein-S18p-alanine acetyltransferase [Melissococcus plutonius]KMT25664.1 ribosomal-protein-S18p-alanine acetyltransferase [Melissococcus plutonius]KMT26299.1 ribosomal-protein-S18p-alanine acetyltransferase [Melissoco
MILTKEQLSRERASSQLWQLSEVSYVNGSPWTEQQFFDDLLQPHSQYLIFIEENEWLGYLGYHVLLSEVQINNFVITKNKQKQGIGKQLFATFQQQLIDEKIEKVFLEVRESNKVARHFYEMLGFSMIGHRKNYYQAPKEHAWVMCKKLEGEKYGENEKSVTISNRK